MRIAFIAVLLAGCSGSSPLPPPVRCSPPKLAATNPQLGLPGDELSVEVTFDTDCPAPTAIEASVVDAENSQVPVTATQSAYVGTVKFKAQRSGSHHVTARFQPNRGTVQTDVLIVRDRSAEPGLDLLLPDAGSIELSDAGYVVADAAAYRVAPQELIRTFSGPVLVSGDVLWAQEGQSVTRYVPAELPDGGSGFVARPSTAAFALGGELFPTRDDACIVNDRDVAYAHVNSAGDAWSYVIIPQAPSAGTVRRIGERLYLFAPVGICGVKLEAAGAGWGCSLMGTFADDHLGGDSAGFWMKNRAFLLHYDGVTTLALPLPPDAQVTGTSAPRVRVGAREYVAFFDGQSVGLEYWGPLVSASSTTIATRVDAGVVRVRRR